MKRKKISKACGSNSSNEETEAGQVDIHHSGGSIINLPSHVLAAILFRLPIKEIIACKCICKSLYATISNPDFAQSQIFPIARTIDHTDVSRILYPLELELDERSMDKFSSQQCHNCPEICMKFDSKLKIPVRNFPMVLRDSIDGNEEITLKAKDHGYKVVNSCNGFLCLCKPSDNEPLVVCNPVTGEYINLPEVIKGKKIDGYEDYIDCGFGFNPKTNQYKVVRISEQYSYPDYDTIGRLAQVHILGTGSWKNIESAPYSGYMLAFPTYLNGSLHWLCHLGEKLSLMVSFDCEKECFLPFSSPPLKDGNRVNVGMGVLGGCLCVCDSSNQSLISVWVMKNYGVEKPWTQVFEIDMTCSDILLYGLYQPIKYMNNGAVLMFNYPRSVLIYYDPKKPELKLLEFHPKSTYEIVVHTLSLVSLKDVLARCNVEVVNVYSRCAGLKLKGESRAIFLYGKRNNVVESEYEYLYHDYIHQSWDEFWWGKYEYCFSKTWVKPYDEDINLYDDLYDDD
ncbi:F-box protein At3g07870-like [Euphorbia lathyris]|uniref:F-box protein At3g07870-like n=1 Tax=Euphorbia lathyris TaxID=212925 RepID=UPI003313902E